MITRNVEEIFPNQRVMLRRKFKTISSDIYVMDLYGDGGGPPRRVLAKCTKSCTPDEILSEFDALRTFKARCADPRVRSPEPFHVDPVNKIILMEHVEGESFKRVLLGLREPNEDFLDRSIDLAAIALSTFHKAFIRDEAERLSASHFLERDVDLESIEKLTEKCNLMTKSKAFLDFGVWNILVDAYRRREVILVDFPRRDCTFTPHLDLARFVFSLRIMKQHPQFRFLKIRTWDLKRVFNRFAESYGKERGIHVNEEDLLLVHILEREYARRLTTMYAQGSHRIRLAIEGIYMSRFLKRLAGL